MRNFFTILFFSLVIKISAQSNNISVDFLETLTNNFNISTMQSKLQSKGFDFIERQSIYIDNYTYLYGENYDPENEIAHSFLKITSKKDIEELSKIEFEVDNSDFKKYQSELEKKGYKGKSFFETTIVKTVYTLKTIHVIFESETKDGKQNQKLLLVPFKSNFNDYDGISTISYGGEKDNNYEKNILTTKYSDFKHDYVNEQIGDKFYYTKNSLDSKHNYHVAYKFHNKEIQLILYEDDIAKFSYFNKEDAFVLDQWMKAKEVNGEYISDPNRVETLPKLGNLTVIKTVTNFLNGKKIVDIEIKNGQLIKLDIYNPNGDSERSFTFTNGKLNK